MELYKATIMCSSWERGGGGEEERGGGGEEERVKV